MNFKQLKIQPIKKYAVNIAALITFAGGALIFTASKVSITGSYIGAQTGGSIAGIFLILASGFLSLAGKKEDKHGGLEDAVIHGIKYERHALERMEERHMFPTVVEHVINTGEHYRLGHVKDKYKTRGATDAYVCRHIADFAKGGGRIGERIITVCPGNRKWQNVMVLTKGNKIVKTVFSMDDSELEKFMKKYIRNYS